MDVFQKNPEFFQTLGDTAKRLLVPALAAAAGTGAATGYVSSKEHRQGETPRQRRHRIMRNALLGSALGGGATMAIPLGLKTVFSRMDGGRGAGPVSGAIDAAGNAVGRNILPLGAAGAGGMLWRRNIVGSRARAEKEVLGHLGNHFSDRFSARGALTDPLRKMEVVNRVAQGMGAGGQSAALFRANELLQDAGHSGVSLKDMAKDPNRMGVKGMRPQYRNWLAEQGPLAKLMAKTRYAEQYGRLVRPSAARLSGRVNPLLALGLMGGGMLTANELQNKIVGD